MVKTKIKKQDSDHSDKTESKIHTSRNTAKSEDSSQLGSMLNVIIVLLVVVIILLVINIFNSSSTMDGNSTLTEIDEKVTRLDNFFTNNIPEYESGSQDSGSTQGAGESGSQSIITQELSIENRPTLGSADAPIQIIEYSDFRCTFCGAASGLGPGYDRLIQQRPDFVPFGPNFKRLAEEGAISFTYKDFPVSGGANAAVAGKCVYRELGNEVFFEYHDTLFENQQSINTSNLKQWSIDVGLEESVYDECIQDASIQEQVQEDFEEGQSIGVTGTPSVALNDKLIIGACSFETYEQAIELELEGADYSVENCQIVQN